MSSFQKEVILDPSSYFLLDFGQFRSFPVTSGRVFMHQKIVSSLFYNILEAQRCIFNHMSTPDEMKKAVRDTLYTTEQIGTVFIQGAFLVFNHLNFSVFPIQGIPIQLPKLQSPKSNHLGTKSNNLLEQSYLGV